MSGRVGTNSIDWQSSCAILAGKVVSWQQNTEKTSGANNITVVNGHKTLDLVPVEKIPKPLLPPTYHRPMRGSTLPVTYQGVPGSNSEAAGGKAYPDCEAIPGHQFEVALRGGALDRRSSFFSWSWVKGVKVEARTYSVVNW